MDREIRLLEFYKIKGSLSQLTVTPMGRDLAEDLAPTSDLTLAKRWQAETTEAVSLLKRMLVSLDGVPDLRRLLEMASRGSMLGEEQLLGVLRLLNAVTKLKNVFKEKVDYPVLTDLVNEMDALPPLREELKQILDEDGRLRDNASPELYRLRRAITAGEKDLRERFDRFVKNSANQKILQESLVTVRGERLVVPVRQDSRSQVPGVVYDQSASGATLFIEPMWAVDTNNRLTVLRREAEREREKILVRLSQWAGSEKESLVYSLNLYAEFDFILAKGRYSLKLQGTEPKLNNHGYLKILDGCHPLLTGDVVPICLEMGESLRTLVITGPNTGGKTVTLKTVGLFSLMAQSGLHVLAKEGTELAVFPRIFADIGDEQDITQSLSTFSGHLKNIIEIMKDLVPGSLVLLDEVGAGTDPTEGAGLAMAILEYLHNYGAVTVATTHYSQIKSFAYMTEGMENASVEFDVATLRPTYQLLVGVPGVSNAFNIAKRLGLTEEVIARGKEFLSQEETRLEEVVVDLVAGQRRMELASKQVEDERKQTHTLLLQVQSEKGELARRKAEILDKARIEAQELITRAKRDGQAYLKQVKKLARENVPPVAVEVEKIQLELQRIEQDYQIPLTLPANSKMLTLEELKPGMDVYVGSLRQRGTLIQIDQDRAEVLVGAMRMQVKFSDLSSVSPQKDKQKKYAMTFHVADVPSSIDLHGLTLDEAIYLVDKYLDEAWAAGHKEVRLVHGRGTGRLRIGLQSYLRPHPRVASYQLAQPADGGIGVTIVKFN